MVGDNKKTGKKGSELHGWIQIEELDRHQTITPGQ